MPEDLSYENTNSILPSITTATELPETASAPAENAPALPDSPEAYALGLEELLSTDESLSGMQIDSALEADFRKIAHSMGLKQEDAGNLAQMYLRHQARQSAETASRQAKALQEAEAGWLNELKADKNFPAQLSRARMAVKNYGSPELIDVLENTRLGSHPAFVRFMARVGEALAEPSFTRGESKVADKSPAEVLYPNQHKL